MNTKIILNIIATIFIILGIVLISYAGFTYTSTEELAQIGPITIENSEQNTIRFSPLAGVAFIAIGIVTFIFNKMRR